MSQQTNHKQTCRQRIVGQGLNCPDDDVFSGPFHESMNDRCITMYQLESPQSESYFGDPETLQYPQIQIRIRNKHFDEGEEDARNIWELFQNWDPGGNYLITKCLSSSPVYIGADEDSRHEWDVTVTLWIQE